jgi:hypothetical protein
VNLVPTDVTIVKPPEIIVNYAKKTESMPQPVTAQVDSSMMDQAKSDMNVTVPVTLVPEALILV